MYDTWTRKTQILGHKPSFQTVAPYANARTPTCGTNLVQGSTALVGVVVANLLFVVAPHLVTEVVVLPTGVRVNIPFLKT